MRPEVGPGPALIRTTLSAVRPRNLLRLAFGHAVGLMTGGVDRTE